MPKHKLITRTATQGKCISVVGDTYRILVSGKETKGEFAIMEFDVPPGGGPGPHSHTEFHESFYISDGQIEVKSEAGTFTAKKGSFVTIPKGGIIHEFKNKSKKNAVMICTVVPAGLEEFFLKIGKPTTVGKFLPPPKMDDPKIAEKMKKTAEQYHQKVYPPDYLDKKK